MAAATVVIVPVLVLFLFAQRYFIKGPPDRPHRHQGLDRRTPLGVPTVDVTGSAAGWRAGYGRISGMKGLRWGCSHRVAGGIDRVRRNDTEESRHEVARATRAD